MDNYFIFSQNPLRHVLVESIQPSIMYTELEPFLLCCYAPIA
jgi:hypothetical protein